jgi:hypothetical protein
MYLLGIGHPKHPSLDHLISEQVREADDRDTLLRVRAVHRTLTGSSLLPINKDWVIKVEISPRMPDHPLTC